MATSRSRRSARTTSRRSRRAWPSSPRCSASSPAGSGWRPDRGTHDRRTTAPRAPADDRTAPRRRRRRRQLSRRRFLAAAAGAGAVGGRGQRRGRGASSVRRSPTRSPARPARAAPAPVPGPRHASSSRSTACTRPGIVAPGPPAAGHADGRLRRRGIGPGGAGLDPARADPTRPRPGRRLLAGRRATRCSRRPRAASPARRPDRPT